MKEDPCITFGSRRNMLVTDAPKEDVKGPLRSISVSGSVNWARVYLDFRQEKKDTFVSLLPTLTNVAWLW